MTDTLHLPDRVLDAPELRLTAALVADPARWRGRVHHEPDRRPPS